MIHPSNPEDCGGSSNLYGFNLVRTWKQSGVRRGARVKALSVLSVHGYCDVFKAAIGSALSNYFDASVRGNEDEGLSILRALFRDLNNLQIGRFPFQLARFNECASHRRHSPRVSYDDDDDDVDVSLSIEESEGQYKRAEKEGEDETQHVSVSGEDGPRNFPVVVRGSRMETAKLCVSKLVRIFSENYGMMRIFHGIVTGKRIVFVGHNHAASDLGAIVLSCVAMVAPLLPDVIRRTYPYATLSDLGFLETKEYIVGVTNPIFLSNNQNWWDLICVLDLPTGTGHVKVVASESRAPKESSLPRDVSSNFKNSTNTSASIAATRMDDNVKLEANRQEDVESSTDSIGD